MQHNFNTKPPPNYVAGLGRGATGFTTRSDIGPARMLPGSELGAASAAGPARAPPAGQPADKPQDLSETKFDHFNGYEERLFGDTPYEEDDKLADEVWQAVDAQLDKRRKARREAREQEELKKFRATRPKLQHQFADLKRDLETVSYAEWEALPEPGAHIKGAQAAKRSERFTKAPDSLLDRAKREIEGASVVQDDGAGAGAGAGGGSTDTPLADLKSLGQARNSVLEVKLDLAGDSVTGQTVVDPKGYLTGMASVKVSSEAEIGDIKKARLLLDSVRQTNPSHAPAWIASARLEEVAGRLSKAIELMKQACAACPGAEDVWLESARLHSKDGAKLVLAEAVRAVPQSVKVWLHAASLEDDGRLRRLVLRKALEVLPNSVKLWQAAIDLETPQDAKLMLARAVECVPHAVDMWLALARLETYDNARKALNRALTAVPTEPLIWIAAIKLEEANGHGEQCDALVGRMMKWLDQHEAAPERELWLSEAEAAERAGAPLTCDAILRAALPIGIDPEDRRRIWMEDAETFVTKGAHECARATFAACLAAYPTKRSVWERAAQHEKAHGSREALAALLRRAVGYCPHAEGLWLMAAAERREAGDVAGARGVLTDAFRANGSSEAVWLAGVQLEFDEGEHERARALLARARERAGTERIWARSVAVERSLGDLHAAHELAVGGIATHPRCAELHVARAAVELKRSAVGEARATYARAVKACADAPSVWIGAAALEAADGALGKARSLLESARLRMPAEPRLWLEAVRLERRAGNAQAASALMAKALQSCPTAGTLWAEAIAMEPRQTQKAKSSDALKRCDNDPHVILAVSRLFWRDRKLDKARVWCNRAAALDPLLGDAWANFYAFELEHGTAAQQADVLARAVSAAPQHGEHWKRMADDPASCSMPLAELVKRVAEAMRLS
ncbi:hypothetical protein KFE25_000156 [Diacronema lutheri]|uniref:PRP1 splicing factor N-terminal domain-containing protein n=1 Tax=Diacronema lutheri TaxID=2081491 RepID=A0A8J6CDX8_DIALT|nr:hypothetical protein KFE25_000156 [Diacronema lutheri]